MASPELGHDDDVCFPPYRVLCSQRHLTQISVTPQKACGDGKQSPFLSLQAPGVEIAARTQAHEGAYKPLVCCTAQGQEHDDAADSLAQGHELLGEAVGDPFPAWQISQDVVEPLLLEDSPQKNCDKGTPQPDCCRASKGGQYDSVGTHGLDTGFFAQENGQNSGSDTGFFKETYPPGWKPLRIFGEEVWLPADASIHSHVGKLVEVQLNSLLSDEDMRRIQEMLFPTLLVEWIDNTLCFQMPSSSATDVASKFEHQIVSYLIRRGKESTVDVRPSSSLFKSTPPNGGSRICADLTFFELTGYRQKVQAALATGHTIPENVKVYATMEIQSQSQSDHVIREACQREAYLMSCISIALLVKTGFVEVHNAAGICISRQYNPRFIDVGRHCPDLPGLRLYMERLRETGGWPFPSRSNSFVFDSGHADIMSFLLPAIRNGNFELAENMINYMSSLADERPLVEAVKMATYQPQILGALDFVEYLLQNGSQLSEGTQSVSAGLVAMAGRNGQVISLLQLYGASLPLNLRPDDMVQAVMKGETELVDVVKLLIRAGCDPSPEALVAAIDRGRDDLVSVLIEEGCDPNKLTEDGRLPLVEAIPKINLVKAIVNAAAHLNVRKKDARSISAIGYAKRMRFVEIVKLLEGKERGARRRQTNKLAQVIKKIISKN